MTHLQYMPGDSRLVDQLVYELKSKGIFDQFRKECIADVDTRPAYQNLRQRVENSVSSFLARQTWKPDLNKNQLREKLRKHILDGNYLEQGVERIVDQVVNPKVASVFIPQVEDLVYNYLGITRKKSINTAEASNGKIDTVDLLLTDLEAVSPGSVKSNDDKAEVMDQDIVEENNVDLADIILPGEAEKPVDKKEEDSQKVKDEMQLPEINDLTLNSESSEDKTKVILHDEIELENIPAPENSPPKFDLDKIEKSETEVPHPDEIPLPNVPKEDPYFKPIQLPSDDESSSDSSLRRNMSPLTPIRNYNNENSYDAQQGFDNDSDSKSTDKKEPSSFRFAIDTKSPENSPQEKPEKKENEQELNMSYQFTNQVNINTFNTPLYDDSSNSNNLQIDYESDANSKSNNVQKVTEQHDQNAEDTKKDKKGDGKKSSSSSHKSSHRSRDSHRHSSSKDKRSDSKQSSSRDSSRHDKKSKDEHSKSKTYHIYKEGEKSKDKGDKKDRDSSRHRSSSHKSSSNKDSRSHRGSSSSQKHSSDKSDKKSSDDKYNSSSHREKSERTSDKNSRDKRDSRSSSHRSDKDKDRKSSSKSKHEDKDKKKDKKENDDHYSLSGRGSNSRRSTDRDSNDGSSSSKGSQNHSNSKTAESKKSNKESSSKSETASTSGDSVSPCDKEQVMNKTDEIKSSQRPIRVENHLEVPIASPPRLPFVPDITLKKPKFAANLEEAKRMMKMRKFLDEEQKKMNQEAALLLEFQANVRPSLSQVYSSVPGPELEFACINHTNIVNNIESQIYATSLVESDLVPVDSDTVQEENENQEVTVNTSEIINEANNPPIDNTVKESGEPQHSPDRHATYNENKPFSELMHEISEISKASEKKKDVDSLNENENKGRTEYFEVTIITEELSETEEPVDDNETIGTEPLANNNEMVPEASIETSDACEVQARTDDDCSLKYFAEDERNEAEQKRDRYSNFLKAYSEKIMSKKVYLLNCDSYKENILKEVLSTFGEYEIVNYYRNGHLKLPTSAKNVVKNVNLVSEITLPVECNAGSKSPSHYQSKSPSPVFSPVKSECSFELSSDYDAKLEEMVNKTSRQEVLEIILGSAIESDNATIDYCMDSNIDSDQNSKRKLSEVEGIVNNNRNMPTKMRKLSDSDQITSTTEENEGIAKNIQVSNPPRSKYLGRARRVGLPRPKKTNLPNSPSSDKSVENYEHNTEDTPQTPNGKIKTASRNKVQRYDTSELYKPKLHYLSRRNNIS